MALYQLEEFKPPQFLGFIRNVPAPEPFIGSRWLPNQTTDDLSFEYVLGASRRPVMASVMGFDSEAPIHGRPGLGQTVGGELPPIKRKAKFGEKEIIRFLAPRAGTGDVQSAIDSVYQLTGDLLDSVQARVEWLRLKALSETTVEYNENGVIFEFDFGIDKDFDWDFVTKQDGNSSTDSSLGGTWSDTANSTPIYDLQQVQSLVVAKTGRPLSEFVLSSKALQYMLTSDSIRTIVRGANAPTGVLTMAELNSVLSAYNLPSITTYDVVVNKENADGSYTDERPLEQNLAFAVPAGYSASNKTLWGPTAESRVLYGTPLAGQAPGIWAETYGTTEPPAEWTKVAAVAFPSMPEADKIAQFKLFS